MLLNKENSSTETNFGSSLCSKTTKWTKIKPRNDRIFAINRAQNMSRFSNGEDKICVS